MRAKRAEQTNGAPAKNASQARRLLIRSFYMKIFSAEITATTAPTALITP